MSKFVPGWYVVYTRPNHEKRVTEQCSESQIPHLLPSTRALRNWKNRKKYVDLPLFPSYVFVYLKTIADYYQSMHLAGVLYFVRNGGEVARVTETVVNSIKVLMEFGTEITATDEHFFPGQQLYIQKGPLTGVQCEFVEYNNKRKLLVRVNLLKRNLIMTVAPDFFASVRDLASC